jgi:hypothetical protein
MPRRTWILIAVVCFTAFGVVRMVYAAPLLFSDEPWALVPLALLTQGVLAVVAAAALFYRMGIAAGLVVALGVAVGVSALCEAFLWDVSAPLEGVLVFAGAILGAVFFARFVRAEPAD